MLTRVPAQLAGQPRPPLPTWYNIIMNSKKRSLEPSGALHKGTKKKKQEPGPRVCGINARYASDPFLSELSQAWR